ncbi:MAG TPA: ABC transporter ATP-binding protein [Solirubrobacteraceae bacterium]|nr:ABC transporter ATP-binding protein [Solirubrobacteraceae bacterium]
MTHAPPPPTGWIRRLATYARPHRRDVVLALGATILGSAAQTVVPLIEREIVDRVILHHESPLWPWLTVLLVLAAASFGLAYVRRYHGAMVGLKVQYALRNEMHDHLQTLDLENLDRMPTGQLVGRANSDATLVQGLLGILPLMSGNLLGLVLSLSVMVYLSPLLALVSLLVTPLLVVLSYRMRWRVFPASWDGQQREGDLAQIVDECVNGVRVVKAFGQERRELERLATAAQTLYGSRMRAVRLQSRYQPLIAQIPTISQVAILALGGWLALHHRITLGTFLAFSTYLTQLSAPARLLAGVLTIAQQARAGAGRIFQLIDLPPAIIDAQDAVELPDLRGEIRFEDVHLSYGDGDPVLDGLDLRIPAGERLAIVGPSGSGKSTAALLVSRFRDPAAGAVLLDGHDVRDVSLHSLRRQVGVVFEESFLFSDTVAANIAYGRPQATVEEIRAAADVAAADEFIRELPDGYDTVVGERGLTLSGGQRQRIALARAILIDPRILILDDATSAIDAKTEEAIGDRLRLAMAGRTTLIVAHRRSTVSLADRIVVLDGGRVADVGTHDELTDRSRLYRTLITGLDESAGIGDRIEALAARVGSDGTTAAAWVGQSLNTDGRIGAARTIGPQALGPGLGRGGGGSWRLNLAPTPELLARVAALRPVADFPSVDLVRESRHEAQFSLRRLLREFRRPLLVGLALVVIDAVAGLAGPILVKTGIDNGVAHGSRDVLFAASGIFLVVSLADLVDLVAETFVTGRAAERIMLSLRIRIWAQLQRLSLDYYEREMAGRIMTRMTTDVDQFESLIENGLLSALVAGVTFVGVGLTLVLINTTLGLCTLTIAVPLAIATAAFRRRAAVLYDQARERLAVVNADFQESLSGVRESQAFVHEAATIRRFRSLGRDYLDSRVSAQRLVATYFPFVQFLSGAADAIVLGIGAGLVAGGELTSGALIAFILYVDLFFSPIQQLSQVFDSWQQTRVSVSRIGELMGLDTRTPPAADPLDPGALVGEIRLADVRFSYPGGALPAGRRPPEALKGIELRVAAGETIALVGETGAGKSTIVKLLARFYDPDSGAVEVDGHDLRSLDLQAFRRQLGYVPQEGFLFSGSIRENIAYGRPQATDAEVERAARAVEAHEFIVRLDGGYLHQVPERGRSLSAGQRQLIALARAELVDPAILLLDEATSNLDLATEARVAAAMRRVSRGRTTIVIAHRLQTARTADRIVVLAGGRVAEVGSHDELVNSGGRYASMWQAFATAESHLS